MKRAEILDKIKNVYKSCDSMSQLETAQSYCYLLIKKENPRDYGDTFWDALTEEEFYMNYVDECFFETLKRVYEDEINKKK